VFLSVEDTGTGMPPEVLARVFEPFFTTKDVGKGTGLGLSMVYGFAEQSGGHVSIRSTPGEGTCVTILFRAVGQEAGSTDTRYVRTPEGGHERVLLVEDEPNVRQFVASQLSLHGYVVEAVGSGPEALYVLQREGFDLLLTDVVLPKGMSGVQLSEEARRKWPRLKVLLTSGYSEEAFEHHGRPPPGTPLLLKPFKRKQLAEALRNALTQRED
jgi:CheY-like chemotaxis protein